MKDHRSVAREIVEGLENGSIEHVPDLLWSWDSLKFLDEFLRATRAEIMRRARIGVVMDGRRLVTEEDMRVATTPTPEGPTT